MELKFRAYDPVKDIMVFAWIHDTDEINSWVTWDHPVGTGGSNTGVAWNITLFTGLTDKNGKDIYVGDVVNGKWTDQDSLVEAQFIVTFEKGEIHPFTEYTGAASGWLYHTQLSSSDFEVVGNIHQNPELTESDDE